jgi:hypothetical protein
LELRYTNTTTSSTLDLIIYTKMPRTCIKKIIFASKKTLRQLIKPRAPQNWAALSSHVNPNGLIRLGIHVGQNSQHETHDFVRILDTFIPDLGWNTTTTGACRVYVVLKERSSWCEGTKWNIWTSKKKTYMIVNDSIVGSLSPQRRSGFEAPTMSLGKCYFIHQLKRF